MKKHPVKRLEEALAFWENTMFLTRLLVESNKILRGVEILPPGTMVDHWEGYRNDVLHTLDRDFPFKKYRPDVVALRQLKGAGMLAPFPHSLYAWNRYSRRVFHVTRPLQALLNATTLQDISWRDIHWPFESFLVTLDIPIIGSEGEEYDAILFARLGKNIDPDWLGDSPLQIMLLPRWLERVTAFKRSERDRVLTLLLQRKLPQYQRQLERVLADHGMVSEHEKLVLSNISVAPRWFHLPVSTSFEDMLGIEVTDGRKTKKDPYFAEWDAAARVIVGLSLYLTTSGKSGPQTEPSTQEIRLGQDDPRAIRIESEITSVYAGSPPSEDEIEGFLDHKPHGPGEVSASFIMGYWKRPPGQGQNPTAQKTVWVRPHLRRRDRLKPGELPGGLEQDK